MDFQPIFKFLKDLSKNNNREWFEKNKPRYEEAKAVFDSVVSDLLKEMTKFDDSLAGLDPRKLAFRIYRDIRFSKDKTPYKTHMSAAFSAQGKGMGKPGYYFHLELGGKSFVAAGQYMPAPEDLAKIRQEIDYNGDKLVKLLKEAKFKKNFSQFWDEDALKTAPKGYAKDHPNLALLKLKSFVVTHEFKDAALTDPKFLKNVVAIMKSAKPLNDFLRDAVA